MEYLEDDSNSSENHADREWNRLSESFVNDGYREGITAGKEGAVQEGFDEGFATVGAPLGQRIGTLRGCAAGLLSILTAIQDPAQRSIVAETQSIVQELSRVQFIDIVPPDMQAEEHSKVHAKEGVEASAITLATLAEGGETDPMDEVALAFGSLTANDSLASRLRRREEALREVTSLEGRLSNVLLHCHLPVVLG